MTFVGHIVCGPSSIICTLTPPSNIVKGAMSIGRTFSVMFVFFDPLLLLHLIAFAVLHQLTEACESTDQHITSTCDVNTPGYKKVVIGRKNFCNFVRKEYDH